MSVRRLAEESVQPASFAFTGENAAWAQDTIAKYPEGRHHSAVIPLLMRAQEQEGWVTRAAIEEIAAMLEMPVIRVLEVATFYTQYQLKPVGRRAHVQVCGTTPCMLRGAEDLVSLCRRKIAEHPFELNADGTLSWEEVECQGACVNAPMVMISRDTYEDLTAERLEEIIDAFQRGEGDTVPAGPQIDRQASAPEGGPTSLTGEPAPSSSGPQRKPAAGREEPSKAARPRTAAPETAPGLRTPSPKKTSPDVEEAASEPPAEGLESEGSPVSGRRRSETDAGSNESYSLDRKASTRKRRNEAARTDPPLVENVSGTAPPDAEEDSAGDTGRQPPKLSGPRPEGADDLKRIRGVGPKLERMLNGMGIYHFDQIAAWGEAELRWVDSHLQGFTGRATRDDWVGQSRALAGGPGQER